MECTVSLNSVFPDQMMEEEKTYEETVLETVSGPTSDKPPGVDMCVSLSVCNCLYVSECVFPTSSQEKNDSHLKLGFLQ